MGIWGYNHDMFGEKFNVEGSISQLLMPLGVRISLSIHCGIWSLEIRSCKPIRDGKIWNWRGKISENTIFARIRYCFWAFIFDQIWLTDWVLWHLCTYIYTRSAHNKNSGWIDYISWEKKKSKLIFILCLNFRLQNWTIGTPLSAPYLKNQ